MPMRVKSPTYRRLPPISSGLGPLMAGGCDARQVEKLTVVTDHQTQGVTVRQVRDLPRIGMAEPLGTEFVLIVMP